MKHNNQLYIDGQWVDAKGKEIEIFNPANFEKITSITSATEEQVDEAVTSAKKAFKTWKFVDLEERIKYVKKFVEIYRGKFEELRKTLIDEFGVAKSSSFSQIEWPLTEIEVLLDQIKDFKFSHKMKTSIVYKEPYGVFACISPWNYPIMQITRKIIPAILAGNTCVVKPASSTPLSAIKLIEIADEAGFPKGVVNLVQGGGSSIGSYLAKHKLVDAISFTGSTQVGQDMYDYAKNNVKHLVLELGGKSPMLVLDGADVEKAAQTSLTSCFRNTGQTCSCLSRAIVLESKYDEFLEAVKKVHESFKYGNPWDEENRVGPVHSKAQFDQVVKYIELGKKEATLFLGGNYDSSKGYFVEPTVFIDVDNSMEIARNEIFGPVVCVIKVKDVKEAIEVANDTDYGLSSAIFAHRDLALDIARYIEAGDVLINGKAKDGTSPFGGYKMSGISRELGIYGLDACLQTKSVYIDE